MRTILCVSACFISLLVAGCGDGSGSSNGGSAGSGGGTASGGSGGSTATGGSGGTGGSATTGGGGSGTGGSTSTGGTGGAGGATTSGAEFGQPCAMDTDCVDGLVCFDFNAKGTLCTKACQSAADCPAPSSGCNGMGYCKPN
jgi:hypothetical protein